MSIVHVTPGLLDIRAITTFGLHAKPGTDTPIGKFGTGLKYAIATLLRLKCSVRLFVGEVEYEFYTKSDDFRGMEYEQVYMKKRNGILAKWRSVELPFTTMHGKFWEAWQAFRELHSNTLDEGGKTFDTDLWTAEPTDHNTVFVVEGEAYLEAYHNRDKIFLPNALTRREGDDKVQVFDSPSKYLYWRGIRVFDFDKPSKYTYNILDDVELTEDRTLKYQFVAQQKISAYIARSKDRRLISEVVSAEQKFYENKLDFDYVYETPSTEFREVLQKKKSRGGYVAPMALSYYDRYAPSPPPKSETLQEKMTRFAYDASLPLEVQDTFKELLKYELKKLPEDDGVPF